MNPLLEGFAGLFEKPLYWPDSLEWPPAVAPLGPGVVGEGASPGKKQPYFRTKELEIPLPTLAGILLWQGELDQSHEISQALADSYGAYWHGLMHRREPDHANAAYWFRRVGIHPIHAALGKILKAGNWQNLVVQKRAHQNLGWDMFWMNDLCRRAIQSGEPNLVKDLEGLQWAEYRLLLDHSAGVVPSVK
jgi:hypothetical protein